ncbi:flagellar motor switch protein FliG [Desulfocapsa sulfexigens DSM 10523]|uniref:Flagellar motor switch protein FliG n=1 Tax=Desulfocapsa sulfexigens (strain DSM 10523 / SB164P1) TaxID=1167006 RepID=M1P803_DESSD|nr:flagellar motor switch protein FliG [Desulfocapsa sulfexigens]AGF79603.1 flagellar motor switch protein FliG [Desulfocapsa sulfexigens DSM 10523]
MSFETLTGLNKAAVLLMCLGEEASAKIFEELSDEEIGLVTRTIATIDHIPEDVKDKVFASFTEAERIFAGLFVKGNEFAKKAISGLERGTRTDMLLEQFISGTETRPLETISRMQPTMVAGLLEKEHPQTISLVLSTQHVVHASEILSHLPEEMRADVVYRIAMIGKVSPEVLTKIEDALHREIGQVGTKQQSQVGGIDKVVDILNNLKDSMDADILDDIEENDPDMVEEIRKRMFTFENLTALDGRSLQMILREVNNDSLTMALKTASDEMQEKVFANMSARAADMIRDDLEAMGPVRLSEVEAMQQSIVKIAMKLEEEGKLVLGSGGGDELV